MVEKGKSRPGHFFLNEVTLLFFFFVGGWARGDAIERLHAIILDGAFKSLAPDTSLCHFCKIN